MKEIEIREFNAGDNVILAWKNDDNYWMPYNVIVKKGGPYMEFVDPDEDIPIPFVEFFHRIKGKDINGHIIFNMYIWEDTKSCQEWCDFENKINNM